MSGKTKESVNRIVKPNQIDYLLRFFNEDDELILEMESFAHKNKIPILDKLSLQFLLTLIKSKQVENILEIGMAIGYSTIQIAQVLSPSAKVEAIEKSENNLQLAEKFISKSGNKNKIVIHKGDALNILPTLQAKFDLIFLDADKEDYEAILNQSVGLLKSNGVLFVDNLLWHGHTAASRVPSKYKKSTEQIRKFNCLFMNHPELSSAILTIGDGIGFGVKK